MAYTYSDWVTQSTIASKLSQLRLHVQEVSDLISANVSAAGQSYDPSTLRAYYDSLMKELKRLEQAAKQNNGIGRLRTVGMGRVYG